MTITNLIIYGMATWRVARLFVSEEGPFHIFRRIREWAGIEHDTDGNPLIVPLHFFAQLLSCVWCSSMWAGFGWTAFWLISPEISLKFAVPFALSTLALMIERYLRD